MIELHPDGQRRPPPESIQFDKTLISDIVTGGKPLGHDRLANAVGSTAPRAMSED